MFSGQSAEYQICLPCRQISSIPGERSHHRFLVGTSFIPGSIENDPNNAITNNDGNNELHLLRFHEEANEITADLILNHPTGEVWVLSPSLKDERLVLTCGGRGDTRLWRIPVPLPNHEEYNEEDVAAVLESARTEMESVVSLDGETRLDNALWSLADGADMELATTSLRPDGICLTHWDLNTSSALQTSQSILPYTPDTSPACAWDPHSSPNLLSLTHSRSLSLFDLRTSPTTPISTLHNLHRYDLTSLSYNPNKPNVLVTSSRDALLKFHDLRYSTAPRKPLKIVRGGHTHHVTSVEYNPFHDQLLLSCGTDSFVNLWRISSISSAPLLELEEENDDGDGNGSAGPDIRVMKCEAQESVYGTAWSACDAWCFGFVSYDGEVMVQRVPSKEKYKILL